MAAGPLDNRLAFDARSLDALRSRAAADPKSAVRETARQFEALFMQELMKSMRATTTGGGLGGDDTAGAQMGTEMLDSQYASQLSGLPGGLSEAITRHLERQMGLSPGPIPHTGSANNTPPPLAAQPAPTRIPQLGAAGFVQQHGAAAREAEAATGIPAAFMVAQAAHETGWGRKEIRHADGTPAFNLFGIKAGAGWRGPVAEVTTTEYAGGTPRKTVEKFRAYGSYAESFADYARLMKDSPRYSGVVARVSALAAAHKPTEAAAGFALGLQGAGYATDPAYADKLGRVINTTLRLQRSLN
ncbi:MAG: glucosaminidase domain-containing protein [Rubrivivax sp.]|jgi:flagellar protein FlgJ|nr:glucosaminidase domain-containing protein [Betaproteobacteria bacterium]MBP6316760.1 glucosaminidase domain-containing protein [Rubrivivax sp.]MBK7275504.1 glucosaminidase domain-containing protein [Betaproteobacteria bacterium]MBK7458913.1 glucosaminidase domain-containing protein [Betaproteobacteria bacterium]MBK8107182.1 glucosaminidase domain-containing protein [Betaproteobacteria bacterium]